MIIKAGSSEWEVQKNIFKVLDDIDCDKVHVNIDEDVFKNILELITDASYAKKLRIKDLVRTYKAIDYLQADSLMRCCAERIAFYMNNTNSNKKLKKILDVLSATILLEHPPLQTSPLSFHH